MKNLIGLDRQELEDQESDGDQDELDESMSDRGGRGARQTRNARRGHLGDWEKVGWMAAKLQRRVTGVEFL